MSITREQIADLQPGDVVEITDGRFPETIVRGPLHYMNGNLCCRDIPVRWPNGNPYGIPCADLTVISRVPREAPVPPAAAGLQSVLEDVVHTLRLIVERDAATPNTS